MIVELHLSNYARKADLIGAAGADAFNPAAKSGWASLKFEVDEIDINKLNTVPVDLSKLSNVKNNDVVKETVYDKLVAKVNPIHTDRFLLKGKYDTDKSDLETKINEVDKKMPNATGIVKQTDDSFKIIKIEGKTLSITGLATAAVNAVENKITNVSSQENRLWRKYIRYWKQIFYYSWLLVKHLMEKKERISW